MRRPKPSTTPRSRRAPAAVAVAVSRSARGGVHVWRLSLACALLAVLVLLLAVPAAFARVRPAVVERELTAEITPTEAKLGALVNPGGVSAAYRFEYGTSTAYGQSTPFPEGSVGEGSSSRAVWAAASNLAPGTTYHYRVVVTNEGGVAAGPDQTFTTLTAAQAACPNEAFRGGFSAVLPDCRAYELVTPATKTSVQIEGVTEVPAAEGNAIGFTTHEPLPGAPTGGNAYVATRGTGGWGWEDIIPLESYSGAPCVTEGSLALASSDELSRALIRIGRNARASAPEGSHLEKQECNTEGLQVVPGEPVGYENLLVRDNATGDYRLVNAPPTGVTPADAHFEGASADLSHVVFSELAALTPEAPFATVGGPEDLYEWDEGALRLLTVLPGGTPVQGSLAEGSGGSRGISEKGSRIVFTSGGGLYVRVDGSSTVQVDASQKTGGSGGGGSFQTISADGSTILFTDENRLTPGSTAATGQPDLYECVLPEGASRCELSDLTVAQAGEHADVQHVSVFGSKDSSHVYFVAKGVLGEGAEAGQNNLYLWNGATITLIATLGVNDSGAGVVSPDGAWFAFDSLKSLTGYDNTPSNGSPENELFLYDAASKQLVCGSCNPSGEAPIAGEGGAYLAPVAQRPLSDGGRLFFETKEALVPSDTNSQVDVYEYEDGQPSLISSGTSPSASKFEGASESGNDVFFLARQQLLPQDDTGEEARVIYDARVDGGFPETALPPSCATADACRVPVAALPAVFGAPASATFSGAGNLAPPPTVVKKVTKKTVKCKRGFVKGKDGKCIKKPKKKSKRAKKAGHNGRAK